MIALLIIAVIIVIVARAARNADTHQPRILGGDDQHKGMYK